LGRLIGVTENGTQATSYGFDAADRLTTVTQAGQTRTFGYSTAGRLRTASNPESGVTGYEYTAAGRLSKKTDARPVETVLSGFDAAGRALTKSYSDGTPEVTYQYAGERLTKVSNAAAVVEYGFDELDRVTSRKQTVGTAEYTATGQWRPAGLAQETYAGGRTVTYAADAAGRVSGVSGTKGAAAREYASQVTYAAHGAVKEAKLGALYEAVGWNGRLQVKSRRVGASAGAAFQVADLLQLTLDYGAAGNNNGNVGWQSVKIPGVPELRQDYGFDALSRLAWVEEKAGGTVQWRREYGYKEPGNQYVSSWTGLAPEAFTPMAAANFNANNRLLIQGAAYDNAGNQTAIGGWRPRR
jgi:YD repeat-containing protein